MDVLSIGKDYSLGIFHECTYNTKHSQRTSDFIPEKLRGGEMVLCIGSTGRVGKKKHWQGHSANKAKPGETGPDYSFFTGQKNTPINIWQEGMGIGCPL